jgi:alpha-tubulin suppressor-like RCC1 family protein
MRWVMGLHSARPVRSSVVLLALCAACSGGGHPAPKHNASPTAFSHVGALGTVLATGDNTSGQLGIPTRGIVDTLQPVKGIGGIRVLTGIGALAGGGRHSLALRSDGTVLAWGANDFGQLGTGARAPASYPTPVKAADHQRGLLRNVIAIAADSNFSLALLRNGHVVTFGSGNFGQRGVGTTSAPYTPTTVLAENGHGPLSGVRAIAADGSTEMALLRNGTVVGWGANNSGQLGDGTTTTRELPVHVRGINGQGRLSGVVAIALGGHHALAVLRGGSVLSWGANDRGQLGDGTTVPHGFPLPVHGINGVGLLTGATEVSAAEKHGFARLRDGRVAGWGFGTAGQLGNGTPGDKTVPTLVLDPAGAHPLTGVAQIYAGEAYGVALLADGTALSWGAGEAGQLGSGREQARTLPGALSYLGLSPRHVRVVAPGVRHLLLSADP